MQEKLGAIILAAGKGTRMEAGSVNKVTLPLGGKPMILHAAELLKSAEIAPVVIVVGHAQHSVRSLFGEEIIFAQQRKRLGTANAVGIGLKEIPQETEDVLILQGDDSAFYKREIIEKLLEQHRETGAAFTFLTIEVDDPTGLGRVVRDERGNLAGIVEEKDASAEQKKIREINPACYVASVSFLKRYLPRVQKSPVTKEYYLTSLIDIGIKSNENVQAVNAGKIPWKGVNTRRELSEAEELIGRES